MAGKKGRSGRKGRSYSFVVITKGALDAKFADPDQPIVVGRVWAEMQGFDGSLAVPADKLGSKIEGTIPGTGVEVKQVIYND